jgi:glycosyltransferase involved in cell wall biosynthesis
MGKTAENEVSVVLTVLNGERVIHRAVDSVLAQTFRDFTFYIVNDGSTDGTLAILESYRRCDSRIVLINHEKNMGIAAALNAGIARAGGGLIIRADADDFNFPDRFEKQITFMREHPDIDVLGGAMERVTSAGRVFSITRQPETDAAIKKKMYVRVPFFHPTVVFRKSFWEKNGGYDPRWRQCEDFDLWLRGYKEAKYYNLPDLLVRYQAPVELKLRRSLEVFKMILVNAKRNRDFVNPAFALAKFSIARVYFRFFRSKYFADE